MKYESKYLNILFIFYLINLMNKIQLTNQKIQWLQE